MIIPIIQVQKLRPREAQKLTKLWQVAKGTQGPTVILFDSLRALETAASEAVPGSF